MKIVLAILSLVPLIVTSVSIACEGPGEKKGIKYDRIAKGFDNIIAVSEPQLMINAEYYRISSFGDPEYLAPEVCQRLNLPYENATAVFSGNINVQATFVEWSKNSKPRLVYKEGTFVQSIQCK